MNAALSVGAAFMVVGGVAKLTKGVKAANVAGVLSDKAKTVKTFLKKSAGNVSGAFKKKKSSGYLLEMDLQLFAVKEGKKAAKGGSYSLNEGLYTRYMPDGNSVVDVTNLPGTTGVEMSRRLTTEEMTFLTQEYGVEFAQVYHRGAGKNGGGGYCKLYSGNYNSVDISNSIGPDAILINHTHPKGPEQPSYADKALLQYLQSMGSPQNVSEIIPIGKTHTVFFDVNGIKH